jgi:hypothetical protein
MANKRKYGDIKDMVPRLQSICEDMILRKKKMQCNQTWYALGLVKIEIDF